MPDSSPVVLIGLDAAEIDMVDRLIAEGRMPALASLRARGSWGPVRTGPRGFLSLVWSTFTCSAPLGQHGWYFNKIWNPDRQRLQYVDPTWLPVRPFWTDLDPKYRVGVIDLPYLAGLSADAVPALMTLPRPLRDCAVLANHDRLIDRPDDWRGSSWGRATARDLLRGPRPEYHPACGYRD